MYPDLQKIAPGALLNMQNNLLKSDGGAADQDQLKAAADNIDIDISGA